MSNSIDNKITYKEHPIYLAAKKIKENGYDIGNSYGMKIDNISIDSYGAVLGIIESKESKPEGLLELMVSKVIPPRGKYVGTLWFDAEGGRIKAKHDEEWVLEVYGKQNVQKLVNIVQEISNQYNVRVKVNLMSEETKNEFLPRDLSR